MNPLTAKTPYYSDRTFRTKELTPIVGFASKESAIAWLNQTLNDYRIQATYTPEQIQQITRLLVEIALETIRQTGDKIDYRGIVAYQQALQKSLSDQRAAIYNSEVIRAWEAVKQNYQQTGRFIVDLGEYLCEPVLLSIRDEKPVKDWAVEPTDKVAVVRCFDIKEEKYAKETWKEVNSNPNIGISVGHLHAFIWNTEIFGRTPEPVYHEFKTLVEQRLEQFKQEHGTIPQTFTFKSSNIMKQVVGGDLFLVGFRITIKSLVEQNGEPKQGVLGKLLSRLPRP